MLYFWSRLRFRKFPYCFFVSLIILTDLLILLGNFFYSFCCIKFRINSFYKRAFNFISSRRTIFCLFCISFIPNSIHYLFLTLWHNAGLLFHIGFSSNLFRKIFLLSRIQVLLLLPPL
uniref:Uncharacterized protein n=1 Tax=Ciona intestinalis TaxID=7719 RepID=H2XLT3_CIOIN